MFYSGPITSAFGFLGAGLAMQLLPTQQVGLLYLSACFVGLGFSCMFLAALDVIEIYFDK